MALPIHPLFSRLFVFLGLIALGSLTLAGCPAAEPPLDPPCRVNKPPVVGGGELMLPGSDCIDCHRAEGSASKSPLLVAGTVFRGKTCAEPQDQLTVKITDATGKTFELTTNEAGNFFTNDAIQFPIEVSVRKGDAESKMQSKLTQGQGSCNTCHTNTATLGYLTPP